MTPTPAARSRAPRLDKEARREQLLDVARSVLVERGAAGFTMEALAAAAGVNKAVPYRHFDNALHVVAELRQAFVIEIGVRVLQAATTEGEVSDRVRALVRAYFGAVRDHADLLRVLNGVAPGGPDAEPGERVHITFATDLLAEQFAVPRREAAALAGLVTGGLQGAAESWAAGEASRTRIEEGLVAALTAAIEAARTRGS